MPRARTWTRELIAQAMRHWRAATGDWPTQLDWTPSQSERRGRTAALAEWRRGDYPSASSVRVVYGSWAAALGAVSTRPRGLPYTHRDRARVDKWTPEAITKRLQQWAAVHDGQPPSYQQWSPAMAVRRDRPDMAEEFYRGDWPDASVAARAFGGRWADALRAAGFQARDSGGQQA